MLKAVAELRLQANTYGSFLHQSVGKDGKVTAPEPPPIPEKAVTRIEQMAFEVLSAADKSHQRYQDFKIDFRRTAPEPPGQLFGGPTVESLKWSYHALHQWLDDLYWELYSILTPETMKDPHSTTYNINVRDVSGLVNINTVLDKAVQTVNAAPNLLGQNKDRLRDLLTELREALAAAPASAAPHTELVAEQAEAVATEASRPDRRNKAIEIKANGLLEAAKALEGLLPTAFSVAQRIAQFVTGIS